MITQARISPSNTNIPVNAAPPSPTNHSSMSECRDVFVVFVDHTECNWLKLLRSGFRHCFVGIREDKIWLICDSLKRHMDLFSIDTLGEIDLPTFYADQGHAVITGKRLLNTSRKHPSIELLTCVAVTKRLLGIQASGIWTPWQLFQLLLSNSLQPGNWRQVRSHHHDGTKIWT